MRSVALLSLKAAIDLTRWTWTRTRRKDAVSFRAPDTEPAQIPKAGCARTNAPDAPEYICWQQSKPSQTRLWASTVKALRSPRPATKTS